MSYIDYCLKCKYAFTSKCIPNSRECNAEKALILAELKAGSAANEADRTIRQLQIEKEKLKDEIVTLQKEKEEIAFLFEAALEVLNDGSCEKNCWKCAHFHNCHRNSNHFKWRLTDDAFNLIYKGVKKNDT